MLTNTSTQQMFANLGIHWASSIPAFLALACVPFPFLFYKYGHVVRRSCRYAAEAEDFMKKMMAGRMKQQAEKEESGGVTAEPADVEQPGAQEKDMTQEKDVPGLAAENGRGD
jgi:hypothetical protein